MGNVPALLGVLQRLAILKWLAAAFCALAMLCTSTATASALEGVQTKIRVWGFELAEHNSAGLSIAASPRTHPQNQPAELKLASDSPHAARGTTTLFHGSDVASVEHLVANGLDKAAARALGGGDVFWATTDKGIASIFAQANPTGTAPAVAAMKIPTPALESLIKSGAVAIDRTGAYMIKNWAAFNNAVVERGMVK